MSHSTDFKILNEMKRNLVVKVEEKLCLDSTRRDFAEDVAANLVALVNIGCPQGLSGNNRYNRVLLGRKAVGKTYLIDALQGAASTILKEHGLICVRIEFSTNAHIEDPLDYVIKQLGIKWQLWWIIQQWRHHWVDLLSVLEKSLASAGLRIFVVVDELQNVFKAKPSTPEAPISSGGAGFIERLSQIGSSESGIMYWLLCGSSPELRPLLTAKLDIREFKDKYPSYNGVDLNGTKFVHMSISPFTEASHFRELLQRLNINCAGENTTAEECKLYCASGGVPGVLDLYARSGSMQLNAHSTSCKGQNLQHNSMQRKILSAILKAVISIIPIAPCEGELTSLEAFANCSILVPVQAVLKQIDKESLSDVTAALLCNMNDSGRIRYSDRVPETIGLATPHQILQLWSSDIPSVEELVALRTGNGVPKGDLCGDTTLRLIAKSASSNAEAFSLSVQQPLACAGIATLVLDDSPIDATDCLNTMYKEGFGKGDKKDALGADGVVINRTEYSGSYAYTVHRIQVKIQTKVDVDAVISRFTTMRSDARRTYANALGEGAKIHHRWVVATTANIVPSDRTKLQENGIVLWDKKFLSKHVWPDIVKALGSKFN